MNDSRPFPSDTRSAVLAAARQLFAERGYDGASVRAITARAGANLGAVTYHFGSKTSLYHEVLTSMMAPLRDRIAEAAAADAPPLDRLDAVVGAYFGHFADQPDLPRFLMERITSGQRPPRPIAEAMRAILGLVSGVVREGQEDGSIRDGDPLLMTLSLVGQPVYLSLVKEPLRRTVDVRLDLDSLVRHTRAFVRAGLASDSQRP